MVHRAMLPPPPSLLAGASLFLDFDGTLVELAERPDAVIVGEAVATLLDALAAALPGRVAIVSGRSIAQLDAMLGARAQSLVLAGSHGAERRTATEGHVRPARSDALVAASAALSAHAAENALVFEEKSLGAALHYRRTPAGETDAIAAAHAVADEFDLVVQRGKMMVEVRAPGDKGQALAALMTLPAMAGTRPLFFGDDVTDEDGFAAAAGGGGAGVLVGEARPSAARYRLPDVAALHGWLHAALGHAA